MNEYNTSVATMLRTLADYVEMNQDNVKVRIGVGMRLPKSGVVSIPVLPVDQFSARLAQWASKQIVKTVENYQQVTGTTEGQDMVERFTQADEWLGEVDKSLRV